jgi:hypothetical protein
LKPAGQTVCETPISKITRAKWTGDVTQVVELARVRSRVQTPVPPKKKEKKTKKFDITARYGVYAL